MISQEAGIDHRRLFVISLLSLFTAGLSTALRASIAADLQHNFLDHIDLARSTIMIGEILGVAFLGFAVMLFIGSTFLDVIGTRRVLWGAATCFSIGTLVLVFADLLADGDGIYWALWSGMLICGIGWGCVEAAINPLTMTLYPDDKTNRLNILHAWWPGGLIAGGLAGILLGNAGLSWEFRIGLVLIPSALIAFLLIGAKFPVTERTASGISMKDMMLETIRKPGFLIWFFAMFLTTAAELAPGQFVDLVLTQTVGMRGILLLVYVSGLTFVMRHFSGPMVRLLTPVGLLWVSCLLASAGLFLLSIANSPTTAMLAATVWGIGVCYMWPTMLASASERYPRAGSFAVGLMGTAGALSITLVLPKMGAIFDQAKIEYAGGMKAFTLLSAPELDLAMGYAAKVTFQSIALLPLSLLIVFGAIWYRDKKQGGYQPARILSH